MYSLTAANKLLPMDEKVPLNKHLAHHFQRHNFAKRGELPLVVRDASTLLSSNVFWDRELFVQG